MIKISQTGQERQAARQYTYIQVSQTYLEEKTKALVFGTFITVYRPAPWFNFDLPTICCICTCSQLESIYNMMGARSLRFTSVCLSNVINVLGNICNIILH